MYVKRVRRKKKYWHKKEFTFPKSRTRRAITKKSVGARGQKRAGPMGWGEGRKRGFTG